MLCRNVKWKIVLFRGIEVKKLCEHVVWRVRRMFLICWCTKDTFFVYGEGVCGRSVYVLFYCFLYGILYWNWKHSSAEHFYIVGMWL